MSTFDFACLPLNRPHSFISLRGSKEPVGHRARAKSHDQLIRTAQKTQKIATAISAAEHLAPQNHSPSARTPQALFNCSNLGLDPMRPQLQAVHRQTLGLRSDLPNQSAIHTANRSSAKQYYLILTHSSRLFTSLQHRANKTQTPPKSACHSNSAPALYLSASAALPCDFLRIATPTTPRNPTAVDKLCMSLQNSLKINKHAGFRRMNFLHELRFPPKPCTLLILHDRLSSPPPSSFSAIRIFGS